MSLDARTTIVLPTLNEERNIGRMVDTLRRLYPRATLLVADDGSTDQTQHVAREHGAQVLDRSSCAVKGITAAVLDAFRRVRTDYVVVLDADFQHPPEAVAEILLELRTADLVIGVRRKIIGHWGVPRHAASRLGGMLAQVRLRRSVRDPLSGFFGVRTALLHGLPIDRFELRCFKVLFQILKQLDFASTMVRSVPYDFGVRHAGASKLGVRQTLYFMKSLVR